MLIRTLVYEFVFISSTLCVSCVSCLLNFISYAQYTGKYNSLLCKHVICYFMLHKCFHIFTFTQWRIQSMTLAPNVPIWEHPKKDFLNNFLEVILQKPCNTHRHNYLEKLLINNKCKTQFQCLLQALFSVDTPLL